MWSSMAATVYFVRHHFEAPTVGYFNFPLGRCGNGPGVLHVIFMPCTSALWYLPTCLNRSSLAHVVVPTWLLR